MSKKMLIGIGLILAALILLLTGCIEIETPPENWDVEDATSAWTKVKTGTIDVKIYHRSKTCDAAPVCDQYSSCHGSYVQFTFNDGSTYLIGRIRRFGAVIEGSSGSLHKYDTGDSDEDSWFQWVENGSSQKAKSVSEVKTSQPTVSSKRTTEKIKKSWKNAKIVLPNAHKPVIVKFKNGIITIAYVDQKENWKLTSNRKKTSGGSSIYDVDEWQELDLE